jgi:N-acetylglutamate synthase-like GNAT family acetyltransferase
VGSGRPPGRARRGPAARSRDQSSEDKLEYALHENIEFVVAERDGRPIACGALQRLDAGTGEMKRRYVLPDARRTGVARMVITAFEDRARERGLTRLRLETARAFTAAVGPLPVQRVRRQPN